MKVEVSPPTRQDRALAQAAADSINAYWRARGVDANAHVGKDGEIVSAFSTPSAKAGKLTPSAKAEKPNASAKAEKPNAAGKARPASFDETIADRLARVERFVANRGLAGATVIDVAFSLKITRQQAYTALRALIDDGVLTYVDRLAFPQRFRAAASICGEGA